MRDSKAYNPPLLFLVGLLTFCLGVIAAIFGAIDKIDGLPGKLLGSVLAWAAVTALVGTISVAVLQISRSLGQKDDPPPPWLVYATILTPLPFGVVVAISCVRLGAAIAGTDGIRATLLGVFG